MTSWANTTFKALLVRYDDDFYRQKRAKPRLYGCQCKKRDDWLSWGGPCDLRALALLGRTDGRVLESHHADLPVDVGHLRSDPLIHDRDTGPDVVEAQGVPEFVSA